MPVEITIILLFLCVMHAARHRSSWCLTSAIIILTFLLALHLAPPASMGVRADGLRTHGIMAQHAGGLR